MEENIWEDLIEKYNSLVCMISDYNEKIESGQFLKYSNKLNIKFVNNIASAHIINLLMEDDSLYIPNKDILLLILQQSQFVNYIDWNASNDKYFLKPIIESQKVLVIKKLVETCFDEKSKKFIEEVCAQDIVYGSDVALKIEAFLHGITITIELEIKGQEEFIHRLYLLRKKGDNMIRNTQIEKKYDYEYRNRGALIRNQVFKHSYIGRKITDKVILTHENNEVLDYRVDKNFCQAAIIHVGVSLTGSCGTGFLISEDGYALTCAHVVEGVKEIYATIINGDGYSVGDNEGFEVYDAGDGEVIYINKQLDIALLKMEHYGNGYLSIEKKPLLPELGEEVVVFGYPLGYEMPQSNFFGPNISFYKGYVSSNQVRDGNSVTFLDIDVKSGNSGSPVISVKTGKVIGIISGAKLGGRIGLNEKMPYMIPIQHFVELNK